MKKSLFAIPDNRLPTIIDQWPKNASIEPAYFSIAGPHTCKRWIRGELPHATNYNTLTTPNGQLPF